MTGETMNETEQALVDGTTIDEFIASERVRDPEFAAEWDKQALTEAVAKAMYEDQEGLVWEQLYPNWKVPWRRRATAAIAAVRQFDEQAALNCGHCTPNADEIACACTIKERDDE